MKPVANFSIGMRVEVEGSRSKASKYTNRRDAYGHYHETLYIYGGGKGIVKDFIRNGVVVTLNKAPHIATWLSPTQIRPTSDPLENMPKTKVKPIFEYMELLK